MNILNSKNKESKAQVIIIITRKEKEKRKEEGGRRKEALDRKNKSRKGVEELWSGFV